jgi:hypothetical protein
MKFDTNQHTPNYIRTREIGKEIVQRGDRRFTSVTDEEYLPPGAMENAEIAKAMQSGNCLKLNAALF